MLRGALPVAQPPLSVHQSRLVQTVALRGNAAEPGKNSTFVRVDLHTDLLIFACVLAPLCEILHLPPVVLAIGQRSHRAESKQRVER